MNSNLSDLDMLCSAEDCIIGSIKSSRNVPEAVIFALGISVKNMERKTGEYGRKILIPCIPMLVRCLELVYKYGRDVRGYIKSVFLVFLCVGKSRGVERCLTSYALIDTMITASYHMGMDFENVCRDILDAGRETALRLNYDVAEVEAKFTRHIQKVHNRLTQYILSNSSTKKQYTPIIKF